MGKQRIKPPASRKGHRIQAPDVTNYDDRPPIFSLERVRDGDYSFSRLGPELLIVKLIKAQWLRSYRYPSFWASA
uniref:Uncharacterized protein n=1 Tax=Candidatus Kentrum sp. DK TaxID=2126562 RepID=A0A450TAX2_9GAMM|nr:MAG: hypothetical protein BECKDK2373C_GA0170839_111215 [Candidatus Kentron sp. DK]